MVLECHTVSMLLKCTRNGNPISEFGRKLRRSVLHYTTEIWS